MSSEPSPVAGVAQCAWYERDIVEIILFNSEQQQSTVLGVRFNCDDATRRTDKLRSTCNMDADIRSDVNKCVTGLQNLLHRVRDVWFVSSGHLW